MDTAEKITAAKTRLGELKQEHAGGVARIARDEAQLSTLEIQIAALEAALPAEPAQA